MSLIHLKQGIPELFICLLCVFSPSMTTSLTLIKEGLGWLVSLPFVLINGGCSAQAQGVSEIKYPAHTERDRANAGAAGRQASPLLPWQLCCCLVSSNIFLQSNSSPCYDGLRQNDCFLRILMESCWQIHKKYLNVP